MLVNGIFLLGRNDKGTIILIGLVRLQGAGQGQCYKPVLESFPNVKSFYRIAL